MNEGCRVFWGSHGCDRPRGHDGPHLCLSCWTEGDEDGWVGAPPYYGHGWHLDRYLTPRTHFYGEDAPFTHRLRSVVRNRRIWGRSIAVGVLRGKL